MFQSRRTFLCRVLLSLPALSILSACDSNKTSTKKRINTLSKLLRHSELAAHLGKLNIALNPDLQSLSLEQLMADIFGRTTMDEELFALDAQSIRTYLDQKIRRDFSVENVVKLDGWLLSTTEATICTLLYRSNQ